MMEASYTIKQNAGMISFALTICKQKGTINMISTYTRPFLAFEHHFKMFPADISRLMRSPRNQKYLSHQDDV